jgi:hypothetical protein
VDSTIVQQIHGVEMSVALYELTSYTAIVCGTSIRRIAKLTASVEPATWSIGV